MARKLAKYRIFKTTDNIRKKDYDMSNIKYAEILTEKSENPWKIKVMALTAFILEWEIKLIPESKSRRLWDGKKAISLKIFAEAAHLFDVYSVMLLFAPQQSAVMSSYSCTEEYLSSLIA